MPQRSEPSLPLPRQEVAEAVLPGSPDSLIVIGGFDPAARSTTTVQWFVAGGWRTGPDYPFPVDHASAATADGQLYVAGGNSNGVARADLYRLGQATPAGWVRLAPMHHPRGALALVDVGRLLYAMGGAAGGEVAPVEAYDSVQDRWTDVATLPVPRNHLSGFAWRGKACVAGGRSPTTGRVDCYDVASGAWSRLPDLPVASSGAGATALGDEVIVAGGENAVESTLIDHVFRFAGGAWADEAMLVPRHGIQLAVLAGRAWACGGATAPSVQAVTACTSIA